MAKRKGLSKRTRFEVFKRDGFRCLYCGRTPVAISLVVDHVIPVSAGGTSTLENLLTACEDCNSGKSAVPLHVKAAPLTTAEAVEDHAAQIAAYLAEQKKLIAAREGVADSLADLWQATLGPMSQEMYDRLPKLAEEWSVEKLGEAMRITARWSGKLQRYDYYDSVRQAKYFHGVLRKWREQ